MTQHRGIRHLHGLLDHLGQVVDAVAAVHAATIVAVALHPATSFFLTLLMSSCIEPAMSLAEGSDRG